MFNLIALKKWLTLPLFVYVATVTLAFAEQSSASPDNAEDQQVLLVLGDSLSAAYGIDPKLGWVNLLAEKLQQHSAAEGQPRGVPIKVVNASVSGATTAAGHAALPGLLKHHQPRWVLLELGANDGLQGLPLPYIANSLEGLITRIQSSGAQVILFGMQLPPNLGERYTQPFRQLFADLASKYDLLYVPFLLDGVAGDAALMQQDGLHPNAKAQSRIFSNVWSVVAPSLVSVQTTTEP